MKYHPDINPGNAAKTKFIEIVNAYEYLINQSSSGSTSNKESRNNASKEDIEKIKDLLQKVAEEKKKKKRHERAKRVREQKAKDQQKQFTQAIYVLFGLVLLYFTISKSYHWYVNWVIDSDAVVSNVRVDAIGQNKMKYSFIANGEKINEVQYVSGSHLVMRADNGLPLRIGDEFEIVFNKNRPNYHRINFEKVSASTLNFYFNKISSKFKKIYAEDWKDLTEIEIKRNADCLTLLTFDKFHFKGLARVLHYDYSILDNFSNNQITWYFFKDKEEYVKLNKQCNGKDIDED